MIMQTNIEQLLLAAEGDSAATAALNEEFADELYWNKRNVDVDELRAGVDKELTAPGPCVPIKLSIHEMAAYLDSLNWRK